MPNPVAGLARSGRCRAYHRRCDGIDPAQATVRTADGAMLSYDRLVVALGSRVAKPDIPGWPSSVSTSTPTTARRGCRHISVVWPTAPQNPRPLPRWSSAPDSPASRPPVSFRGCSRTRWGRGHAAGDPRRSQPACRLGHGRVGPSGHRGRVGRQPRRHLDGVRASPPSTREASLSRPAKSCRRRRGAGARNAGEPVDGAVPGAVRPPRPPAGQRLSEVEGVTGVFAAGMSAVARMRRRTHVSDVVSARSADGPLRGLQRDQ